MSVPAVKPQRALRAGRSGTAAPRELPLAAGTIRTAWPGGTIAPIRVVRGREAILNAQPVLAAFAARCGQAGEADSLRFFLSTPDAVKKTPVLVLLAAGGEGLHATGFTAEHLLGAVLLFEYRAGLQLGLRIYAGADATGRRNVFAPAALRARVAACAARTLIERGAEIVHLAFSETHGDNSGEPLPMPGGYARSMIASELCVADSRLNGGRWALGETVMPLYLPLERSFDATLAHIGQRTRSNLRYYRRRAEATLGCRFVPQVEITIDDFLAINRRCKYAVPDKLARHRFADLGRDLWLAGIRDQDGEWLSLAAGRHHAGFATIDWQMNREDLPEHSLSTVIRSYLIEHEIARGSTRLYIEGGTPQPIGRSFVQEHVSELTVKRRSAYVWLIERLARHLAPAKNYLAQTLQREDLMWRRW